MSIKLWQDITPPWWEGDWHESKAANYFARILETGTVIHLHASPEFVAAQLCCKDRHQLRDVLKIASEQ